MTPPADSFDTADGRTYSEPATATPGQAERFALGELVRTAAGEIRRCRSVAVVCQACEAQIAAVLLAADAYAKAAAQEPKPAPVPSRTEWVVFWGGEDPGDCAGWDSRDDEADAEEHREWIVGGGVAQRPVMYGPWTVTVPPPPAERGLLGDWSDEELAEFRRWREQKQETGQ